MDQSPNQFRQWPTPLRWVPEVLRVGRQRLRTQARMMISAMLVGIVAGVGAIGFYLATQLIEHAALGAICGYEPAVRPAGETVPSWMPATAATFRPWLLLVVPTVGGLLSGWLVYTFAPEAEGHGTDAVIDSYHRKDGVIRPRVPFIKTIASALTLGSGGSGGREGPIAQIGAGFGSILGNLLGMQPAEKRVVLAAGMGAGIAAIFRAPLAGALFAAEVLYWSPEFEPEVIIPAGMASVVSYCTFALYSGWKPLFAIPADLSFTNPWQLGPYTILALWVVLLSMLYTRSFYGFTRWFHRLAIAPHFKPALGALATGAVGLGLYYAFGAESDLRRNEVLSVLSFGYGGLQQAISDGSVAGAGVLLAIALGKILTTGLTIGSGGSGGVFGPSVVIGGCAGGALGIVLSNWWPGLALNPASFAIVGMAGFFAAAAKTPFSTIVIVSEMTGGYQLLLPALWVCMLAFLLSDTQSIYSSQVENRSSSPAHQGSFLQHLLGDAVVGQYFKAGALPAMLRPSDPLATVLERMNQANITVLPVVDDQQRLLGVVNLEEVHYASQSATLPPLVLAADLMRGNVTPLQADDPLERAQQLFVENDLLALPLVNDLDERQVIGMVRRFDIANAFVRRLQGQGFAANNQTPGVRG